MSSQPNEQLNPYQAPQASLSDMQPVLPSKSIRSALASPGFYWGIVWRLALVVLILAILLMLFIPLFIFGV